MTLAKKTTFDQHIKHLKVLFTILLGNLLSTFSHSGKKVKGILTINNDMQSQREKKEEKNMEKGPFSML